MASACHRLPRLAGSRARLLTATILRSNVTRPHSASIRSVATTQLNRAVQRRYGKGAEPAAWERQKQDQEAVEDVEDVDGDLQPVLTTATEVDAERGEETVRREVVPPTDQEVKAVDAPTAGDTAGREQEAGSSHTDEANTASSSTGNEAQSGASEASTVSAEDAAQQPQEQQQTGPMDAVLHMAPPRQHPHLTPPPYVHHFDTYSLVKELGDGGYTPEQAIEVMKGVRAILAGNLDVAQESLVSKSDVENESYLFRAACSELSTEIKNNRRLQDEQMRQQRTHLQHEVDILTQSLNQELLTLTDTVRGMFNDRKMAVREEQKSVESAVQQISYKISIMLSSDAKSEIEGVRWILIRRSVLGILFMAVLTLGTLRYATYVGQERKKEEAERRRKEAEEDGRRDIVKRGEESPADAALMLAAN